MTSQEIQTLLETQRAYFKSGVTILGQAGSLALPTISQDSTTKILSIS